MPLPTIANTARVQVRGICSNGQPWSNVLHYRFTGGGAPTTAQQATLATEVTKLYTTAYSAGADAWKDTAASTSSVTDSIITMLDGSSASIVTPISVGGALVQDPLPAGVALVFTLRTNQRGRRFRGRCYWAGYTEGNNAAPGVPSSSLVTRALSQWSQHRTGLPGITWELVVASYVAAVATTVLSVTNDGRWDTQRRRQSV